MTDKNDEILTIESDREPVPWRRLGEGLVTAILLVVVLSFVVYAVPQVVGADQSYVALSGSMEPAISPGDAIIVEEVDPSAVERGDVITFERPSESRTTTHRVVEVVETDDGIAFRTKGDANDDADHGSVPPSQLEGRVMAIGGHLFVLPYLGHVVGFAKTQVGFATMVVAPIALLVLSEIRTIASSVSAGAGSTGDGDSRGGSGDASPGGHGDESHDGGRDGSHGGNDEGSRGGDGVGPVTADRNGPAAGTDPGATSTSDPSTAPDGLVTLYPGELRVGLVVLGAFLAYSVLVAYVTPAVWTITVAASVAATFVLGVSLYSGGARDEPTAADPASTTGGDRDASDPAGRLLTGDAETTVAFDSEVFDEFQPQAVQTTAAVDRVPDGDAPLEPGSGGEGSEVTATAGRTDSAVDHGPTERTEPTDVAGNDGSEGETDG